MPIIDAHQKRLAELDEEISHIDREINGQARRRRGNPAGDAAERVEHAKQQRGKLTAIRAEIEGDIHAIRKHECSPARVAHRSRGREALDAVLATKDDRIKAADTMDRAAKIFLAALDEMSKLGATAQAGVGEAAQAAVPFLSDLMDSSDNTRLMEQRRLMNESTAPHAGAFTGPDMQYALVVFLAQILERLPNSRGIAQIAPGWQFDNQTTMPFAQAAQQAHERMEFGAQRIVAALAEPK